MPSYMIRFKDGSFHYYKGIGHSTTVHNDAARYYSVEAAVKMVWELQDVDAIITSSYQPTVVRQY